MTLRRRTALSAALAAGVLALAGCGGGGTPAPGATGGGQASTTLTLGTVVDATAWDPAQAHVGHYIQMYQAAYDTLIKRAPDGELEPMLATDWEWNEDNTVFTLNLRSDVTFSDGAAFNAEAVKANLEHFKEANGPQASTMNNVESVEVVDEDTVAYHLSAPDPALPFYLANAAGFMGSPEALGTDEIVSEPVGTGPYVIDKASTVTGSQYTFTKREDYWAPELQKFDTVVFKFMQDTTARLNALVSGQVDAALLDPKSEAQATGAGIELTTLPVDWQGLFLFDRAGEQVEALGDVKVRQAINHAIDRESMLQAILQGRGTVTSQILGETTAGYDEALDSYYDYDPEKAKSLLAEAGYADGFSLTLPVSPGFDPVIFSSIAQQLGEVGITVQQDSVQGNDYRNNVLAGQYPAAFYGIFQGEPWIAVGHHIGPNAAFNPTGYTDETSKALIDRMQQGGEDADAAAKELGRYITEEAWFAPFFRVDQMYFNRPGITVEQQIQQAVPSLYNYAPAS
ncbi:ABC transporter substrate-binding protein [Zafaria sp. Z1313]|uniref:ABC transporter substrate-binding protein n=1 Tax=unclassified Zafaria TaxID=2828765 RepID=UPI002E776ECD|nr:ABC transporter substrate-binding protein [Zafaria sp. J156]MEE1621802.1 ABC transporter substrate-binding protein [Zafaria sp. J156]